MPRQIVEEFYSWIFQVSVPVPWQEVVRNRRVYLTDILWGKLREQAVRGNFEFDPFLDSESGADSYKLLACEQKGERAMVSVAITGAKGPSGKHDRKITVQVDHELDGWKIANVYYQWAQQEDLLSLCRRLR